LAPLSRQIQQGWQRLKGGNLGEVLGHAKNYFAGDLATKGLGLISIPVFTRLMDREDFGVVSIFTATVGLLSIASTLNATDAIGRYYYEEKKSDFGQFLSSVIQLIAFIQIPLILLLLTFGNSIMAWLQLPVELRYFLIVAMLHGTVQKIFGGIHVSQKKSKEYVMVNVVQGYSGFGFAWVFLLVLSGAQYLQRISGLAISQLLAGIWMGAKSWSYVIWQKIKWEHVRYSLQFALPRLPYVLSGIVLSQFDRIMLGNMLGADEAGLYSVGYNVGGLSLLLLGAITPALMPNFYQLMNEGKTKVVDRLNQQVMWLVCGSGVVLMLLGGWLLRLLADERFHAGAQVIPAVVMGCMFFALAGVYNRYSGYYKATILQSLGAIGGAVVNVVLNYFLIPKYGFIAAAYATTAAYFFQAISTWLLVYFGVRGYVSPIRLFIMPLLLPLFVFLILLFWWVG
jgi:O-antigen/teichoic acid export membrane protein